MGQFATRYLRRLGNVRLAYPLRDAPDGHRAHLEQRRHLRARVAAGAATIGRVAALAVGGLMAGDTPPARSQVAPAAYTVQASTTDECAQQRFLEQNQLPTGERQGTVSAEERPFLEQNQLLGDTTPTTDRDDPSTMPQ